MTINEKVSVEKDCVYNVKKGVNKNINIINMWKKKGKK